MDIAKISKCGTILEYKKGDAICIEKEPGETAYMLLSGMAKVSVNGREMAELRAGTLFGEMSLLENLPRSATVMAYSNEVSVLEIGKDDFIDLMKTDNDIAYNLLRMLYTRVQDSINKYQGYMIKLKADILNDEKYVIITKLTSEQFRSIVSKDPKYAVDLLSYLSHTLAKINKKVETI